MPQAIPSSLLTSYAMKRMNKLRATQALFQDAFLWILATAGAFYLRFDGDVAVDLLPFVIGLGFFFGFLGSLLGFGMGLYRRRFVLGSLEEAITLTLLSAWVGTAVVVVVWIVQPLVGIPRTVPIITSGVFLVLAFGWRGAVRIRRNNLRQNSDGRSTAIIYGAGLAGRQALSSLLDDPHSNLRPIGFIDDDPDLLNLEVRGVRVLGPWSEYSSISERLRPDSLLVAIPGANSELLSRVFKETVGSAVEVRVLPTLREFLKETAAPRFKQVSIEDLVGRAAVPINRSDLNDLITDSRVLVTGAGGHIGAELVRQISGFRPQALFLADRDETLMSSAKRKAMDEEPRTLIEDWLVDIRDGIALEEMFTRLKPDLVVHAAALKHVGVLERFPEEAWKTNVLGTINVLRAAQRSGCKSFVNISTDKAAHPSNVLGKSKRLGEEVTEWFARETGLNYCSVRFGNVLGSRGSLTPIIEEQIQRGGPIRLTDARATRFFMSTSEACGLVLQAAALSEGSGILVLDMGNPVRIVDVAEKLMQISGKSVPIEFIGLRPGETLHEQLWDMSDVRVETSHSLISRILAVPRSPEEVLRTGGFT